MIAAALLFGFLRSGGINMEMMAGVPTALVLVIQGLIVIALAGAALILDREAQGERDELRRLLAVFIGSSHPPRHAADAGRRSASW